MTLRIDRSHILSPFLLKKGDAYDYTTLFSLCEKKLLSWKAGANQYQKSGIDVIDFFCGCGGMSLGFAAMNDVFRPLGGIDINQTALSSYAYNFGTPVVCKDVQEIDDDYIEHIKQTFHLEGKRPLVVIGCAPCQGFSAHRKRDKEKPEDQRNTLIGYFAEIAVKLHPDYVVMENVPEILTGKYRSHYDEAKAVFQESGYHIVQTVYNAAGFGVPQARNRAIIVASRKRMELPKELLSPKDYRTVREAIGNLPEANSKQGADQYHRSSHHRQSTIDIISQVPHDGGSRPSGIGPACLDRVKGFYDVYGRLAWDKPAITITQYARNPASGRFTHPEQDRGLTIREAARLQSFPDGFILKGSLGDCFRQIGEAVPPLLALAIATKIALMENACVR